MGAWQAEIAIEPRAAHELISSQVPQFERLEPLGQGWDYTAFLVDDDYVFRFPRRAVVLPGMEREIATLPRLALPVQTPTPLYVGDATADFPYRFYGAPYIEGGEPLAVSDDVRRRVSIDLARSLRALHAHDPADLPEDA